MSAKGTSSGRAHPERDVEIVVLGGTVAAVLAAALLAKRGLSVALIDHGELTGGSYALLGDLALDPRGSLPAELVVAELGIGGAIAGAGLLEPVLQAIFADHRVDLSSDAPRSARELERAFGARGGQSWLELLRRLEAIAARGERLIAELGPYPASGFVARQLAGRVVRRFPDATASVRASRLLEGLPEEVAQIALGLSTVLTGGGALEPDGVSALRFARPIVRLLRGPRALPAGLRETVLEQARAFTTPPRVIRGVVERIDAAARPFTITIAGERAPLRARVLIDATSDVSGLVVLADPKLRPLLDRVSRSSRPDVGARPPAAGNGITAPGAHFSAPGVNCWRALRVEVDREVVPPGLAERALLLDERPPLLLIAEGGSSRARLLAVAPVAAACTTGADAPKIDDAIRSRLERLIPFLPDGHPAFEPVGRSALARDAGAGFVHPRFDPALDPLANLGGLPVETPIKDLWLAGPAVLPGLGVEGQHVSALRAADRAEAHLLGRRHPRTLGARGRATSSPDVSTR